MSNIKFNEYHFYIQRDGDAQAKDIEHDFEGCRYIKCEGLSDYGKVKNIVKEDYAEADMPRVYIPETITRKESNVVLMLYFHGEARRGSYDSFVNYITGHKLTYWDTCRNRKVNLLLEDEVQVKDDVLYGGNPYLVCAVKFTNLKGSNEESQS